MRRVENAGGLCKKFIPDHDNGFPDRIVMLPEGKLIWVELKRASDGELRPLQQMQHQKLRKVGQRVEVAWSKADVDRILK